GATIAPCAAPIDDCPGRGARPSSFFLVCGAHLMNRRTLLAVVALSSAQMVLAADHGAVHHWQYQGESGPSHWGALEKDFASCGIGKVQSPIDIKSASAKTADLPAIAFDYRASPLRIIDNGHTVQVNYAP